MSNSFRLFSEFSFRGVAAIAFALMCSMTTSADASPPTTSPTTAPSPTMSIIVESKHGEAASTTYEQYISFQKSQYADDASSSRKLGVTSPAPEKLRSAMLTQAQYEERLHDDRFECLRILYRSDQLKVAGYIFKPVQTEGKKLPAIIYNRGGQGNLGAIGPMSMLEMHAFLADGFVVLASQYRGCDGGEGKDELGGADVHDVLNLFPVARHSATWIWTTCLCTACPAAGWRTYLAIKHGAPINAASVLGAPADEVSGSKRRPMTDVYDQLVPGFKQSPEAAYRARSAVYWAETLNTPLLLLHGGDDWRVSPSQSLELASRLAELHKTYQLFVYSDDDHNLSLHREQRDRAIIDWFHHYMR